MKMVLKDVDWESELKVPPTAGDIKAPEEFTEEAWNYLRGRNLNQGISTPWKNFGFKFAPGTLNLFFGMSGSGKSQITQQIALHATRDGASETPQRVLLWSAEMPTPAVISTFAKLAGGVKEPTRDYFEKCVNYMSDRIWIYHRNHRVTVDELIGISLFAQRELGVTMVVIDSLVKIYLKANASDYNLAQTELADRLAILARDSGLTVLLVAHARKGENERQRIDKFSLKGSGGISDMASTMFAVNRNIVKSEVMKGLKGKRTEEEVQKVLEQPDCFLECLKNREGGEMPMISLYFNEVGQFVAKPGEVKRIREIDSVE